LNDIFQFVGHFLRYRFDIKAAYYIWSVIIFSVIYNTPRFFEWQTFSEPIKRPCLSTMFQQHLAEMNPDSKENDFDMKYLDWMDGLDDYTLEQIIKQDYTNTNFEVDVDPNQVLDYADNVTSDGSNCTQTVWNVTLIPRSLRTNDYYKMVYMNWMNFLVNVMIPLGILLYMNIAIYKGMKKLHGSPIIATSGANGSILQDTQMRTIRPLKTDLEVPAATSHHIHGQVSVLNVSENEEERERDARFTRASVLIVVAFGLCHTLRLITNFIEMFIDRVNLPDWFEIMVCVNHLLVTINSSFNFLIFLMSSKRKRRDSDTSFAVSAFACQSVVRKSSSVVTNHTNPNPSLQSDRSFRDNQGSVVQIELTLLSPGTSRHSQVDV